MMGNALHFTAQATPAWGDLGFYDASARPRVSGLALITVLNLSTWEEMGIGWHGSAAVDDPDNFSHALQSHATDGRLDNEHGDTVLTGLSTGIEYPLAFVVWGERTHYCVRVSGNWRRVWIDDDATAPLYASFANLNAVGYLGLLREKILGAPFDDNGYSDVTDRKVGNVTAGTEFAHEADCVLEWTMTTVPSSSQLVFIFRRQDASNLWYVAVNHEGTITLFEYAAGSAINRGSASNVVSNGHRVVIVADGTTIRVYSNNVLRITYSGANNFIAETDGAVAQLGTGGAISDLVAWPLTLSGQAATLLDAEVTR